MPGNLRLGSIGAEVARLQAALNLSLRPNPAIPVTGRFDARTDQAVRAFQRQAWLEVDGIVGLCTRNALTGGETFPPVLHAVPFISQPTPTTCWAASAAMMKGGSVAMIRLATPVRMLNAAGALLNESEAGAGNAIHREFGRIHGLHLHPPRCWLPSALIAMVTAAPVMMQCLWNTRSYLRGQGSDGHWVVLVGVRGTRNENGRETSFRIHDPLEGIYSANYAAMLRRVPLATYALFTR
jgi:hypothetical protein